MRSVARREREQLGRAPIEDHPAEQDATDNRDEPDGDADEESGNVPVAALQDAENSEVYGGR